ncbi:MAG: pyrroline-5-carboxylate reductase [Betaproteobacteria bacterium]|nr:pyrroline-5-carboxylate reductase [Betaproteobacteria bacterium]
MSNHDSGIIFLGGGNMAGALIGGLLQKGVMPEKIAVIEVDATARTRLAACGIHVFATPEAAMSWEEWPCATLILAVKPQQMRAALAPLVSALKSQLVISIAAGLRLANLSRWLNGHANIVRAMPNSPALIGAGMTGLVALPGVSDGQRKTASQIMISVGEVLWFDDEAQMDALTAVSGSGPAYVFLFIEALEEAARQMGFSEEESRRLALSTFAGATALAEQTKEPPAILRQRVTSKGGTTEAALQRMDEAGVKAGIVAGVLAARVRSEELGDLLGEN